MASPLIAGSFEGWAVNAARMAFESNREHDGYYYDVLHGSGELLSPPLSGFTPGDQVTVFWEGETSATLQVDCLDSGFDVLGTVTETGDPSGKTTALAMPTATACVRLTLSGDGYPYVGGMEIPGLTVTYPANPIPGSPAMPNGWGDVSGDFTFSHASGVDSGGGFGSISAVSATGGAGSIKTHVFASVDPAKLYTIRGRMSEGLVYQPVNGHWGAFNVDDVQVDGGTLNDRNRLDGGWSTFGFTLPAETSYLRIFAHGGANAPIYFDAINLPPAVAVTSSAFEGYCPSPTLAASGSGSPFGVKTNAPMPRLSCYGAAMASSTPPSPLLTAFCGATASIAAPSQRLTALGRSSAGDYAANLTAPSPVLTITTGANARLLRAPMQTLEATATGTNWGTASVTAPSVTLSSAGTVSAMGGASLRAPIGALVGFAGAVCSITLKGRAQLQANGVTGAVGGAQITAPLFALTASGTMENYGGADLLAPSPKLGGQGQAWLIAPAGRLTAIGIAVVDVAYEAYATNLLHASETHDEVTRYTNYQFTHIVRYQNSYFGANSTGLYLLEGTTDAGTAIPYEIETHPDTFDHPGMKTAVSAYLSGRIDPELTAKIVAGQDAPQTYSYTSPRGATAQTHRVKFGRGVKDRYLAVGLAGNGVLELDEIELEIDKLKRRI